MSSQRISARIEQDNTTLQDFLSSWQRVSRNRAKALIDTRTVFVNGTRIWMARHRLKRGDQVQITVAPPPSTPQRTPEILFDCPAFLVVNKPAGRLSNGPDSTERDVRDFLKDPLLQAAHRLDRDTTGCLLIARSQSTLDAVTNCFKEHRVVKIYHALVAGNIKENELHIEDPIDGEPAVTHLRVLDRNRSATHITIKIETGRTHQIRKHLAKIGHPVLGDKQYGTATELSDELRTVERQMLHAYSIRFTSPLDAKLIKAAAPLPADFKAWMKRTRLD